MSEAVPHFIIRRRNFCVSSWDQIEELVTRTGPCCVPRCPTVLHKNLYSRIPHTLAQSELWLGRGRWVEESMTSKRQVPCPPYCLAVHTWGLLSKESPLKRPCHVSRGRLYSICLLAFLTSFFLALHIVFLGYPRTPLVCLDSYRGNAYNVDEEAVESMRDRVRFPRTKRRLPQCIIIGVRKCGTRALLEFLNLHPSIQKASDEVHFFDEDDKYGLGLEWYRRRMPYSFADQITIEKSPAYFITESAPARIRAMNASVKLLLIVRDPVTRLISDYAQLAANKARKDKALASFEELVLHPNGQVNTAYKAVRISMYSIFFEKWHRVFPRRQIHIVDGDDLVRDPFPEVQRIEEFLGIAHRISKENFFYNKTKGFYCVRNETTEKCLNESKGRRHPEVSEEVIHKLRQFYAPYNRMFFRAAGRDFGWPEE